MSDAQAPARAAARPLGWPDNGLLPHPLAEMFRLMDDFERADLAGRIKANGLRTPIVMYQGQILDGRNRYLAAVAAGLFAADVDWMQSPHFEAFGGMGWDPARGTDALEFVWDTNEGRRHDTVSQRAMNAARYATMKQQTGTGAAANLQKPSLGEAAKKAGVSERAAASAAAVLDHGAAELVAAVDAGRIAVSAAEQVARLPEAEQRELVTGDRKTVKKRAAAVAKKARLPEPPPLIESGPVVKALDAAYGVLFAEAVLKVARDGNPLTPSLVSALAKEHQLLGDEDGTFNLARPFTLTIAAARKRCDLDENQRVHDTDVLIATAMLPEDLDVLSERYRAALRAYDRAIVANELQRATDMAIGMEAILFKANGLVRMGVTVNDAPQRIVKAARAPAGTVPMWGQEGWFEAEADGVRALIHLEGGGSYKLHAVRFDEPFVSETGFRACFLPGNQDDLPGLSVEAAAVEMIRVVLREKGGSLRIPDTIYRLEPEGGVTTIPRGLEIVAGQWPAGIADREAEANEQVRLWKEDQEKAKGRTFAKPRTRGLFIVVLPGCTPVSDYPEAGAYLIEHGGRWRYVDDGSDPGADAVMRRLAAAGSVPDRSAYAAALASLSEPRGKLHQSSAAAAIRAGVEAKVPRAEMAADLGHPIGTILTWTARLGLTDGSRKGAAQ